MTENLGHFQKRTEWHSCFLRWFQRGDAVHIFVRLGFPRTFSYRNIDKIQQQDEAHLITNIILSILHI